MGEIQGRNHVFKDGVPVPWSGVLLPFYRKKKLDRSTKFGAVGYIITLNSLKSYELVGRPNFGVADFPRPHWLSPCSSKPCYTPLICNDVLIPSRLRQAACRMDGSSHTQRQGTDKRADTDRRIDRRTDEQRQWTMT